MSNESNDDYVDDFQDPLEDYDPKTIDDPIERALVEETVDQIQSQPFAAVAPDVTVHAAVDQLAKLHVACLLVVDDGNLVGILTDRNVLDHVALEHDVDGKLAAQGRCSEELVARWLSQPYFSQRPPKSTGRELYNNALADQYRAEAAAAGLSGVDFVATLTDLTAASIADSYRRFAPLPVSEVIICGGGAHNPTLLARIREQLVRRGGKSIEVVRYGDLAGVPGDEDSKEALCFALLAWLTMRAAASNVPGCTGAEGARVLGKIAPGRNFRQLTMKVWGGAA